MESYNSLVKLNGVENTAVALGYFDGIHKGHREVICNAVKVAEEKGLKSCVFTFALPVNSASIKGLSILSVTEKKQRIEKLGIENYYCPPFDSFCNLTPRDFVSEVLVNNLRAKHIFCGQNFKFGKNKSADVQTLTQLCDEFGIEIHIVPMSNYSNEEISSTRIRQALQSGKIETANEMLCDEYAIDFVVQQGHQIGRKMGYPTINQAYPKGMILPKSGVYITKVIINEKSYAAATGLGNRPTFSGENITCETFIIDYSGELYSKNVRVKFYKYLKPTMKFNNTKELEEYIKQAAQSSLNYFANKT